MDIRINVSREGRKWFAAIWIDGEYDGCDALDVADGATADQAMAEAEAMPLLVSGERTVRLVY